VHHTFAYNAAMPLIQVRDVPKATVTALKARAAERLARRNRRGDAPLREILAKLLRAHGDRVARPCRA
jgi:hypothetical protein